MVLRAQAGSAESPPPATPEADLRAHRSFRNVGSHVRRELPRDNTTARAGEHLPQRPGGSALAAVQRAIAEALTPHQRRVLVALALNGVPIDVLAERLNTTRGALYKTLHDARRKLRKQLAECGLSPESLLEEGS